MYLFDLHLVLKQFFVESQQNLLQRQSKVKTDHCSPPCDNKQPSLWHPLLVVTIYLASIDVSLKAFNKGLKNNYVCKIAYNVCYTVSKITHIPIFLLQQRRIVYTHIQTV